MPQKKILFVANSAWNMRRFRSEVLEDYLRRGFKVTVAAPADESAKELIAMGCEFLSFSMSRRGLNPLLDAWSMIQLLKIYKQLKPDFVFHYTIKPNIWGSIATRILSIPNIPVVTGLGYVFVRDSILTRLVSHLYKLAFKKALEVWFLNNDDRDEFIKRKIVPFQKTRVLPGEGINLTEYAYQPDFPSKTSFLLIARMLWDKGIGEFVNAAREFRKQNPEVKFKLLGPVDLGNPSAIPLTQIEAWQNEGLIEYLGEKKDVRQDLKDSTCIVLPSYREGVPRVLLEAAAVGRPIITCDVPGCRETVVNDKSGFLVTPKGHTELIDAIQKIASLKTLELKLLGIAGRQLVESKFSMHIILDFYRKRI